MSSPARAILPGDTLFCICVATLDCRRLEAAPAGLLQHVVVYAILDNRSVYSRLVVDYKPFEQLKVILRLNNKQLQTLFEAAGVDVHVGFANGWCHMSLNLLFKFAFF